MAKLNERQNKEIEEKEPLNEIILDRDLLDNVTIQNQKSNYVSPKTRE
ncbi:MAG: hypothetical protein ACOX4L_06100 [Bacillota bacterium]|jgi:hypothetical protein